MRALVLGGTGFIGRALVGELRSSGHRVLDVHRGRTEPDVLGTADHRGGTVLRLPMVYGAHDDQRREDFVAQHLQFDVTKAATALGWQHADPKACVAASVRWHMEHPPPGTPADLSGDDVALSRA